MSVYAEVLRREDNRVHELYSVERETLDSGSILIDDPFPKLAELRAAAPVHKGTLAELMGYAAPGRAFPHHVPGYPTYTAFSFNAVSGAFIDSEVFSSRGYVTTSTAAMLGDAIITQDGTTHRCVRAAIQPMFTPQAAQEWWSEKVIEETVDILVSAIERKTSADLFVELCARMPVHVVSAGFGLPPEDIIPFRIALTTPHHASREERMRNNQAVEQILSDLIQARRREPENDIVSKLIEAKVEREDGSTRILSDKEILENCRLIVLAGGGTTWRQLGITLFALLNNPDQFEALKANRALVDRVILEAARWHPTDLVFPRQAAADVTLEGVDIPKGSLVHLCLGAANRDPVRWEHPDQFDITRVVQRSVAFGAGPHSCLGQHVSRREMVTALNAVIDRLPDLRWDPSKPRPTLIGGLFARGPSALPVVFG